MTIESMLSREYNRGYFMYCSAWWAVFTIFTRRHIWSLSDVWSVCMI